MAVKNKAVKKQLKPKKLIVAIALALIAAMIISCLSLSDNKKQQTVYDFGKEVAKGIDVSEHNKNVDWDMVAEEFDFAFIRVGYRGYAKGNICRDDYAKDNLKNAEKSKIPFGVYFYTQAVNEKEARQEADFVLDMVKHYDLKLPIIIDYEYPTDSNGQHTGRLFDKNLSPQDSTKIVNAFCERVAEKGYIPGVYASSSMLKYNLVAKDLGKDTVVWAADYGSKVGYGVEYDIWQYSDKGKSDCVESKYVDLNYWYSN